MGPCSAPFGRWPGLAWSYVILALQQARPDVGDTSPLTEDMVAALQARTEGWIAGLQLAAPAMRDCRELASFTAAFSGSRRFVADYLAEEVFLRQPAAVQDFLLRTSLLDRMCVPAWDETHGLVGGPLRVLCLAVLRHAGLRL
jgi:LuxR family maltose regulon positive regulatory protein